ncbi:hypothetical protein [Cellulomonas humilata]|uniref:Gingipain domain-containing protein n=1 Tax=Cellulomonas humilata TaxID=144055 RepID=A0ABU0EFX8_9CELL|nr:hypothetical protein [Cellulomonas humilata]MDQ0373956.1 hypothetical protein [Cellulomonas humilata]
MTELLELNGIDVSTGTYATSPVSLSALAAALRDNGAAPPDARDLRRRHRASEAHFGLAYGYRADDLASAGWGMVVAETISMEIMDALAPLLQLRKDEAGEVFQVLAVRAGESKNDFLARHGTGPSVVDPHVVPYYLLLVGGPEQIPFEFQYQLGVSYAVGRLDLPDPTAYAAYAASVVAAERDDAARRAETSARRSLQLFATRHPDDTPTALSSSRLVEPLGNQLGAHTGVWDTSSDVGAGATKSRLLDLLVGPDGPDVLFTAGHGLSAAPGTPPEVVGALLCQDWPGPLAASGPVDAEHYVAADDLGDAAVRPRVVFTFACFGAGTPRRSDYPGGTGSLVELADRAFTSRLPQRMLSQPAGGALAFVGHVDRAWSCSFLWKRMATQITPFRSTLLALMNGERLGFAMEAMTARYAELATEVTDRLQTERTYGTAVDATELVGLWTALHDSRGYVVLGDPAVRVAPAGSAGLGPGT